MDTKKKLMIGVSVVLLGSAAFMLYRTFFAAPSGPVAAVPAVPAAASLAGSAHSILPYGKDLNFAPIEQYNSSHKQIIYPQVSPDEVGVNPHELIKF